MNPGVMSSAIDEMVGRSRLRVMQYRKWDEVKEAGGLYNFFFRAAASTQRGLQKGGWMDDLS